ncbi:MAG: DNA topoisomerase III [Syntrophomonadaceae bacterium]|jgi:DNA topoisomerase-3|nr:DNA topoisomerase III [Syntrophomonadaceae bacterium]
MKSLVLAEKPSVARDLAKVLRCAKKQKGYIEGNDYVVTWALGHLVTLAEPHDYDEKLKYWNMNQLPMLPQPMKLKVIKNTAPQYRVVKDLLHRQDVKDIIIATDAGREGELVARWIITHAKCKKPLRRLWISSQTDTAIKEGFAALKPGKEYDNLYAAALSRAEADWLVGLNVTRALTCKFDTQLTAGRVQTPTLAMIVRREEEIQKFQPVDYWTIQADFDDYFGDWRDAKGQGRIFDKARAEAVTEKVKAGTGKITEIKKEAKSVPPPLAYDLTELQRDGNRRLGWSAQKTLSILQDLYEVHKIVSYPRTDSRYISSDIVPTLPGRLRAMNTGPYAAFIKPLLSARLNPGKRFVDNGKVSDHHAIIPTEQQLNLGALDIDEKKLYDLIARRFIAVLYPPYLYNQTTLTTVVNGEIFISKGKVVQDWGWRKVTNKAEEADEQEEDTREQSLPEQKKGREKTVRACRTRNAKTKPPARYTEATLLTAMESPGKFIADEELRESMKGSGLGTPATRAEIIEKLFGNFYIERNGKQLFPTSKGVQLIALAPENLRSPDITAEWEQRLTNISRGQMRKEAFIAGIVDVTKEMINSIKADQSQYHQDNLTKHKCPQCGKYMALVNSKQGRLLVCPDRACGFRQPEKPREQDVFKKERVDRRLLERYSGERQDFGQSLGDKLKHALEQKRPDN